MSERGGLARTALAAVRSPNKGLRVLMAIARGHWCKLSCRVRGVRFECGHNLRVYGRLSIKGPGTVRFGDNVVVDMMVTPWTYHPEAVIEVGDGTFLNGTQFGCVSSITLGPGCIVGRSSIMDTNFHSTSADRHNPEAQVRVTAVRIGANVWIAAQVGILPGTNIGDNSVVGFGAVCSGDYPPNALIAAAPAAVVRRL
jgi:acetyltransferase-like isoleucine patch superfamily enzyme